MFLIICLFTSNYNSGSIVASAGSIDAQQCLDYGFNSEVLLCKTCEQVGQVLGEQSDAKAKCLDCCVNTVGNDEKYKKAVLELDKRSLNFMPDLKSIVDRKKELKLSVRYSFSSPRLLMFKNSDDVEPSEVISVHSWTKDTFTDYLSSHLIKK